MCLCVCTYVRVNILWYGMGYWEHYVIVRDIHESTVPSMHYVIVRDIQEWRVPRMHYVIVRDVQEWRVPYTWVSFGFPRDVTVWHDMTGRWVVHSGRVQLTIQTIEDISAEIHTFICILKIHYTQQAAHLQSQKDH